MNIYVTYIHKATYIYIYVDRLILIYQYREGVWVVVVQHRILPSPEGKACVLWQPLPSPWHASPPFDSVKEGLVVVVVVVVMVMMMV